MQRVGTLCQNGILLTVLRHLVLSDKFDEKLLV